MKATIMHYTSNQKEDSRLRGLLMLVPSYAFAIFRAQVVYAPESAAYASDIETLENCRREFAVKPEYDWRTREYILRLQQAVDTMVSGLISLSMKYHERAGLIRRERDFRIADDANSQKAFQHLYGAVKIMALFGVTATLTLQIPGVKEFWLTLHGVVASHSGAGVEQAGLASNLGIIAAFVFFFYLVSGSVSQILRRWAVLKLFSHADKLTTGLQQGLAEDSKNLVLEGYRHAELAWQDYFQEQASTNSTAQGYIDMMVSNLLYLRTGDDAKTSDAPHHRNPQPDRTPQR